MCAEVEAGVIEHYGMLRKYALKLDARNADDIVQETILRALRHQATYAPGSNIKAWLIRIARNVFLNGLRQNRDRKTYSLTDQLERTLPSVEASQEWPIQLSEVATAWENPRILRPEHRAALAAIAIEGLSYEEASAAMGIPEGTLKSRAARGRAELARALRR